MSVFYNFPYANFHEINFDWLLHHVKDLDEWIKQFDPELVEHEIQDIINSMVEHGDFDVFFAEWITPLQNELDELTPRVTALETVVEDLSGTVSGHTTAISNLAGTVSDNYNELSGDIATINNITIPGVQSDVDAVSHDLSDLSTDYDNFKTSTNDTLADHETRITALENDEPPAPSWQNRNMTYRGQSFGSLALLLSAIEAGTAYPGDRAGAVLLHPSGSGVVTCAIFVGQLSGNNGAYLVIRPADTYSRGAVGYGSSTIKGFVDALMRYNYEMFNRKLSFISVYDSLGNFDSLAGVLLSSANIIGYPTFDNTSAKRLCKYIPFMDNYLSALSGFMLCDDNGDDSFAVWNSGDAGGYVSIGTNVSTLYNVAFIAKYNIS